MKVPNQKDCPTCREVPLGKLRCGPCLQLMISELHEKNNTLRAQLDEAREALEYYADKNEWIDFKSIGWSGDIVCQVDSHFDKAPWDKARIYLEKYK